MTTHPRGRSIVGLTQAAAGYSVLLMHVTQGRCYSVAEMERRLRDAGFSSPTLVARKA